MESLTAILALLAIFSCWFGYRQYLRLEHLSRKNLTLFFLVLMVALTLLNGAYWLGVVPQEAAARITMGLYTIATGFFFGNGGKLLVKKRRAGRVEYVHQSFWVDIAPNLISSLLVAYGIYRSGILTMGPFTGIGVTSGLSLIGFGFFGWTIRVVPEFRTGGILILDQFIEWKNVLTYQWIMEGAIKIDYLNPGAKICEFNTSIPPEDRLVVERLLGRRIKEHEKERKEQLQKTGEN